MPSFSSIARLFNWKPNTTIKSSEANQELNQIVTAVNSLGTLINAIYNSAATLAGTITLGSRAIFQAGLLADTVDEFTSDAGVTVDSVLLHNGSANLQYIAGTVASIDTSLDVITTGASHGLTTANAVMVRVLGAGVIPAGVSASTVYYANVTSSTALKLYDTAANATGGGSTGLINITSIGTGPIQIVATAPSPVEGQVWVDANGLNAQIHGLTQTFGSLIAGFLVKSANYTALLADKAYVIQCSGTMTLTLPQSPTWFSWATNTGTGEVTVNTASGLIDNLSAIILMPGETLMFQSDGTNIRCVGRTKGWGVLDTKTAASSASIAFTNLIDGTYTHYAILGDKVKMGTNGAAMWIQVTEDGTNWKTASTDYCYSTEGSFSSTSQVLGSAAAAQMVMSTSGTSVPNGFPSATAAILEVHFYSPASTTEPKNFKWENSYFSVQPHNYKGMGQYLGTNNAIVGVRLIPSTGNIASGTFDLYGLRRA